MSNPPVDERDRDRVPPAANSETYLGYTLGTKTEPRAVNHQRDSAGYMFTQCGSVRLGCILTWFSIIRVLPEMTVLELYDGLRVKEREKCSRHRNAGYVWDEVEVLRCGESNMWLGVNCG